MDKSNTRPVRPFLPEENVKNLEMLTKAYDSYSHSDDCQEDQDEMAMSRGNSKFSLEEYRVDKTYYEESSEEEDEQSEVIPQVNRKDSMENSKSSDISNVSGDSSEGKVQFLIDLLLNHRNKISLITEVPDKGDHSGLLITFRKDVPVEICNDLENELFINEFSNGLTFKMLYGTRVNKIYPGDYCTEKEYIELRKNNSVEDTMKFIAKSSMSPAQLGNMFYKYLPNV